MSLARFLCFWGFHKWEAKTRIEDGHTYTFNRCVREGCHRYEQWHFVDSSRLW